MAKATPVVIPHESVNDESVTLISWHVANGEEVKEGQPIASVETSKAVMEITASAAGFARLLFQPGEDIAVGGTLCRIYEDVGQCTSQEPATISAQENVVETVPVRGDQISPPKNARLRPQTSSSRPTGALEESASSNAGSGARSARFSKGAEELLKRHHLEPALFAGRGLVRTVDILEQIAKSDSERQLGPADSVSINHGRLRMPQPMASAGVPVRSEKLPRRKRSEIDNLKTAYHNSLVSNVAVVVPTRGLRAATDQHPEIHGNVTAVVIFEAARLLRKHPHLNAFYLDGKLNFYEEVNIGFAVDGGHGLKVPVIRNADTKGIPEIAHEMQEVIVRYLNDDIPPELLAGGTFTVTDLSGAGVFIFHPLLSQGQAAILGVGSEFFAPGSPSGMFNLVLSFDHQASDGRQAAQFLNELGQRLKHYEEAFAGVNITKEGFEEPYCSKCLKPARELQEWGHFLLLTLQPDGMTRHICSICLQGM